MGASFLNRVEAGGLRSEDVGRHVTVAGWVASRRDHGGVVFLDLRDHSGIVQVVINPEDDPALARVVSNVRLEYCVTVDGEVRSRPEGTINPELPTGEVEVAAEELDVLSPSEPLPFPIQDRAEADELLRLEYRYLDLRRPRMAANLVARSRAIGAIRRALEERGFLEVETPHLIRSTPEGARDLLVPSRLRPGTFYALPQSPQLFKQLLMVAGVHRYYQIARCYRDEDFRSDRQIEFTQLDLEGSFWGQEDVLEAMEAVVAAVVEALRGETPTLPLPRITYQESLLRYGTDKPDVRFGMEISDLSGLFETSEFRAFRAVLDEGGTIRGFNAGALEASRAELDRLVEVAKQAGAQGLVWMLVEPEGEVRSPVAKFLSAAEIEGVLEDLEAKPGDVILVVADRPKVAATVLGRLRSDLGRPEGHDELTFLWVVDFPIFEEGDGGALVPSHHPFTAPVDVVDMRRQPERAVAQAYDLVLNGVEVGGGSIRIHDPEVQREVFEILGISSAEAERRFGWFLRALRFGAPPHGGFALGIDRMVSVLQQEPNIREIIPFPKTQSGLDPLTGAPSPVAEEQLGDLGLRLTPGVVQRDDEG